MTLNLQQIAKTLLAKGIIPPHKSRIELQIIKIGEEAGELQGAYSRWAGASRRSGTFEELCYEMADVIIATSVLAERLNVDIETVVNAKLEIIYDRMQND